MLFVLWFDMNYFWQKGKLYFHEYIDKEYQTEVDCEQ